MPANGHENSPPDGIDVIDSEGMAMLDRVDEAQSYGEKIQNLVEWARQFERGRIADASLRATQHKSALDAIAAEGQRTRSVERDMAEQFGHLAAALMTLGDAVTGVRLDLRNDRAERDEEKAALIGELGMRAKNDSVHDIAIGYHEQEISKTGMAVANAKQAVARASEATAKVGKEVAATQTQVIEVQRRLTGRQMATYIAGTGVAVGVIEAVKEFVKGWGH